jgi:hypothetical protein
MTLRFPKLDDRDFQTLLLDARRIIQQRCPQWTDLSANDPGIVLLELFAHLTETMIYRLNRLPDKAYVEFLRLIGLRLQPPAAASVELRFMLNRPQDRPVEIPLGTRVSASHVTADEQPPMFVTSSTVTIPAGATTADVVAHHGELIEGELAGVSTGQPGFSVNIRRPPVVAPTGRDEPHLVVGVEMKVEDIVERVHAREFEGKWYRIWREVDDFTDVGDDPHVYVADRSAGIITFAPDVQLRGGGEDLTSRRLAAVPAAGK